MAVSGQERLEGFVGEMFPKIVTTESSGFSVYKRFFYIQIWLCQAKTD